MLILLRYSNGLFCRIVLIDYHVLSHESMSARVTRWQYRPAICRYNYKLMWCNTKTPSRQHFFILSLWKTSPSCHPVTSPHHAMKLTFPFMKYFLCSLEMFEARGEEWCWRPLLISDDKKYRLKRVFMTCFYVMDAALWDQGTWELSFNLLLVIMDWTALPRIRFITHENWTGQRCTGLCIPEWIIHTQLEGHGTLWSNIIKYLAVKNWYLYKVRG